MATMTETPRLKRFALIEEGHHYATYKFTSASEAMKYARYNLGSYDDRISTIWIDVRVKEVDEDGDTVEDGEARSARVALDPKEPDCADTHDHDWRSPYSVLGGLESNPGVQRSGGGVVITEVCCHCGYYRETNTWAQDPETGQQGLESVAYTEADEFSLKWLQRRAAKA